MSTGTTARERVGRQHQQQDRADDAADQRGDAEPEHAGALPAELAAVAHRARQRAGHQPDGVGDVGGHGRYAERQQGRERDQRSRPHHRVDGACGQPGQDDGDGLERATPRRSAAGGAGGPAAAARRPAVRRRRAAASATGLAEAPGLARLLRLGDRGLRRPRWPCRPRCRQRAAPGQLGGLALPMSTRVFGPAAARGMPAISVMVEPRPSRALVISLGTIHTLLASPSAIFGIICRYW